MLQLKLLAVKSVEAIPHMVIIPIWAHVKDICHTLRAGGQTISVVVANVGGRLYAIDNIDTLLAYRELGAKTLPCRVVPFRSVEEALLAHMRASATLPVNPLRYGEAAEAARRALGDNALTGLDDEYMRITALPLAPGAKERMDGYIAGLGKRVSRVPSFYPVLRAVSKLDPDAQPDIADRIVKYCERMSRSDRTCVVPDSNNIENLITRIMKRRNRPPKPTARGEETQGGESMIWVEVLGEAQYYHEPSAGGFQFRCGCGSEYFVNTRRFSVRKYEERKDMVVLTGEYSEELYAIRRDAASFLGLDAKPTMNYYMPPDRKHGSAVLLSKRRITRRVLEQIWQILSSRTAVD